MFIIIIMSPSFGLICELNLLKDLLNFTEQLRRKVTKQYSRSDHVNSNWVRVSSHHLKHICERRAVNFYFSQYSEYYIDFLPQRAILRTRIDET